MSGRKRPIDNGQTTTLKAKRKSISLDTKMRIIMRVEAGEKKAHVARSVGLSDSTLRSIISQADKVKASVESTSPLAATKTTRSRSCLIEKMEKMLSLWLSDMTENRVPIKQTHIMEKALCIFNFLKAQEHGNCKETFLASRGWFEKFKKRSKIQSIRLTGEVPKHFAKEASEFQDVFQAIEMQGPPSLVCGAEDAGMLCKKFPARTYISPSSDIPDDDPQDDRLKPPESGREGALIQQNENYAEKKMQELLNTHMLSLANRAMQDIKSTPVVSQDKTLTTDFLLKTLHKIAEVLGDILQNDPNTERSDAVRSSLLDSEFRDVFQAIETQGPPSLVCGSEGAGMLCKKLPARTYISPSSDIPDDDPQDDRLKPPESGREGALIQQNENYAEKEMQELLNAHMLSLANRAMQGNNSTTVVSQDKTLTTDFLLKTLHKIAEVLDDILQNDPNTERSDAVRSSLLDSVACYQDILDQRKRSLNRKRVKR